ncbi:MAG: diphosphomevalonate decarboxylase [Candidatus Diapherotrites archaeon CG11_big_fil_rev_8_21_14_0_20_37_9]|nr:MAG: diphosphomevalonate decarboxylase [Candidatus Diapherotrites archaeon CG11_big_fil_rev_8_21_14_0_20_37_9]
MKATATANSNIALIKYWGKRNSKLILPHNSSISMTLDKLHTTTTVDFSEKYKQDSLTIDGSKVPVDELERVSIQLDLVRRAASTHLKAKVVSESNFPKSAGLASSASAFAALSLSASKALDLHFDNRELSILARQGSGSASRSIHGGFVEWSKGTKDDGSDSYGKQIAPQSHWSSLAMVVNVVTPKEKKIKSRAGMSQTVKNSPLYKAWLETVDADLDNARKAIADKNFSLIGKTAEMNALKMHCTMITTEPHIIYWEPDSVVLMKEVMRLREDGIECYFTMDGGPQVKVLCLEKDAKKIQKRMLGFKEVKESIICHTGGEAKLEKKDLF